MYQFEEYMSKCRRKYVLIAFAAAAIVYFLLSLKIACEPGECSPSEEFERLWNYIYLQRQYECTKNEYLGGREFYGDGAYSLCTEEKFWPAERKTKCLTYSFGVGGDFSFDDVMADRDCEVHSFDPSMKGVDGWVRESGVTFHKIGIGNKDEEKDENGWKMRTLQTLVRELGHSHTGRYMDFLKTDTDKPGGGGFKDTLMQQLIDTGLHKCVRQIGMEIHLPGPISLPKWLARCRRIYRQLKQLNDFGFRIFNVTDNIRSARVHKADYTLLHDAKPFIVNEARTILWEIAMVNLNAEPCL